MKKYDFHLPGKPKNGMMAINNPTTATKEFLDIRYKVFAASLKLLRRECKIKVPRGQFQTLLEPTSLADTESKLRNIEPILAPRLGREKFLPSLFSHSRSLISAPEPS